MKSRKTLRAVGTLTIVASTCLGLVACGGSAGSSSPVRDFRAIEVGKTRLQIAADGRSAVIRVQTDPPSVCAIAYGRTASLGSIADDPSMGGTAISRHTVQLSGLTPNATYRYRLTATDARGNIFQSRELSTFTTTTRKPSAQSRDNAVGVKIVAVSSQ